MTILKHDHEGPSFQLEQSDFRQHYQSVAVRTLRLTVRRWGIIASCVTLALALAFSIIPLMPLKYSAAALIYPSLLSNEHEKTLPRASADASAIVIGEARLVNSDAVLHAVVKRLGLDMRTSSVELPAWASQHLDWFRARYLPETRKVSPFDRAVARLRDNVEVMKDTRSYFISISFSAESADEAAAVVNAIALEYLREKLIQRRQDAVAAAEAELERQRSVYLENHPKVVQATNSLDAARSALDDAMSSDDVGRHASGINGFVKLAIPNRTPTAPKGVVILGLAAMSGLLVGIGLAAWSGRPGRIALAPRLSTLEADPDRSERGRSDATRHKNGVGQQRYLLRNAADYRPSAPEQ